MPLEGWGKLPHPSVHKLATAPRVIAQILTLLREFPGFISFVQGTELAVGTWRAECG